MWLLVVASLVFLAEHGHGAADAPATNTRMRQVIQRLVGESGCQVIGLGSWISGKGYQDPVKGGASDHDLRLLMPKGTSPERARSEWELTRRRLTDLIRREFGSDAPKVLRSVNLYPPTQLMRGVETAEDALERFVRLGSVPNLAYSGEVTLQTPARFAEGLYGDGAAVWTQKYEKDAGRLFYKQNGKVFVGMTDLAHLSEGEARYTIGGMANTARQWADHLDEALEAANPKSIAKYLERLDRDLAKGRDLARCTSSPQWREEVRQMVLRLREQPSAETVQALSSRIREVARQSRIEAAVLARIEGGGTVQKFLLQRLLQGINEADELGKAFGKVLSSVDAPVEKVVNGLVAYLGVMQLSATAGEKGPGEALKEAVPYFSSLPVAVAAAFANAILEAAEEGGYALVAGFQEPWDLMAGIYTAEGRVEEDKVGNFTLEDLVEKVHDPDKLKRLVMAKALAASSRGFGGAGSATGQSDAKVAEAIFNRCYPVILQAWRAKRELLYAEYEVLAEKVASRYLVLTASPQSGKLTKTTKQIGVTCSATSPGGYPDREIERMKAIIKTITGLRPFVSVDYTWSPVGTALEYPNQRRYLFRTPGRYVVSVRRDIVPGARDLPQNNPLARKIQSTALVEVLIEAEAPPVPVKAPAQKPKPPVPPQPGAKLPVAPSQAPARPKEDVLAILHRCDHLRMRMLVHMYWRHKDGGPMWDASEYIHVSPCHPLGSLTNQDWGHEPHPIFWSGTSFRVAFSWNYQADTFEARNWKANIEVTGRVSEDGKHLLELTWRGLETDSEGKKKAEMLVVVRDIPLRAAVSGVKGDGIAYCYADYEMRGPTLKDHLLINASESDAWLDHIEWDDKPRGTRAGFSPLLEIQFQWEGPPEKAR